MQSTVAVLFFALIAAGCGRKVETKDRLVDLAEYSAFHNVTTIDNPALEAAANAIVKIGDSTGSGTGFFVNDSGKLVTNNHVVGVKNCPLTGCFVTINRDYQIGKPFTDAIEVFAVPQVVDTMLDVSVLQIYASDKTTPLASPAFLTLTNDTGATLMNKTVYLVGHPAGGLKKWSQGTVFDYMGEWIEADYFSVGGTSGSPVLNADGQVVGLNHRTSGGATSLTENGYEQSAIFSASAAVANVIAGNTIGIALLDPAQMPSSEDVASDEGAFYNAHQNQVKMNLTDVTVLDALGTACDQGLALTNFQDPDDFDASLASCKAAIKWMNCVDSELESAPYKTCPQGDDRAKWEARFAKKSEKFRAFWTNNIDYDSLKTSSSMFMTDKAEKGKAQQTAFQGELDRVAPPLTPGLAGEIYYRLGSDQYGGVGIPDYLKNYESQPNYNRYTYNIFLGLYYLYKDGIISADDLSFKLKSLVFDGSVPIGDKLDLEAIAYEFELL